MTVKKLIYLITRHYFIWVIFKILMLPVIILSIFYSALIPAIKVFKDELISTCTLLLSCLDLTKNTFIRVKQDADIKFFRN